MAIFTVQRPVDQAHLPATAVLIKEGFCWPALFVPSLWAIANRLWLVLLLMVLALLVLIVIAGPLPGTVVLGLYLLGRLYLALEANGLRRWTLARRGYELVAVVEGRNLEEAERRYFATEGVSSGEEPAVPVSAPMLPSTMPPTGATS